jgi:cell division protein FtsB
MDNQKYISRLQKENESLKTQINDLLASKEVISNFCRDSHFHKNMVIAFLSLFALLELILLTFWVFA